MPLSLPFDDDNVGNEIIYTAEPCEDVEMNECKVNVNHTMKISQVNIKTLLLDIQA
jgi:hypothetical protein